MKRARGVPESPAGWAWCEACSDRLQEIEPRLTTADCDEFAAVLWNADAAGGMPPELAAERFMGGRPEAPGLA
ncbi:hypothetical protein [Rhizobacter sp. LjRoot28]|jgi:hypothetical protein|uniref:hypothetical protein n=1 Tax=Rhizobacter sp. LjRoot28 TaxID=3342309 RepID=UPI003ED067A9